MPILPLPVTDKAAGPIHPSFVDHPRQPPFTVFTSDPWAHRVIEQRPYHSHTAAFPNAPVSNGFSLWNNPVETGSSSARTSQGLATGYPTLGYGAPSQSPFAPGILSNHRTTATNYPLPKVPTANNGYGNSMSTDILLDTPSAASASQNRLSRRGGQSMNVPPQVVPRPAESEAENPVKAFSNMTEQAIKVLSKETGAYKDKIPPDCRPFSISPREYLRQCPNLNHIHTSAAIFTHFCRPSLEKAQFLRAKNDSASGHYHEPRLLLLQRSVEDSAAANCWEMPGGPVGNQDQSILHGLARQIWLLTNLNTSWILRQIGGGDFFTLGWGKFCFEIHCDEIRENSMYHAFSNAKNFHDFVDNIPVRTSGAHRGWSWVTKHGVRLMLEGKVDASFTDGNEGRRALTAFEVRENQGAPAESGSSGPNRPDQPTRPDEPKHPGLPTPQTTPVGPIGPHALLETGTNRGSSQNPRKRRREVEEDL